MEKINIRDGRNRYVQCNGAYPTTGKNREFPGGLRRGYHWLLKLYNQGDPDYSYVDLILDQGAKISASCIYLYEMDDYSHPVMTNPSAENLVAYFKAKRRTPVLIYQEVSLPKALICAGFRVELDDTTKQKLDALKPGECYIFGRKTNDTKPCRNDGEYYVPEYIIAGINVDHQIDSDMVLSRVHCFIMKDGDLYSIYECSSTNSTTYEE